MPIKLIDPPSYQPKETPSMRNVNVDVNFNFNFKIIHVDRFTEDVLFMSPEYGVLRHSWSEGVRQWDGTHWQSAMFLPGRERGKLTKAAAAALSSDSVEIDVMVDNKVHTGRGSNVEEALKAACPDMFSLVQFSTKSH